MADPEAKVKFSLKVVINKHKRKVLYAEADSDFTDVLLSFLTLPLGTIVRIIEKHYGDEAPKIGSLTTLYNGLSNLDNDHFSTESCKQMLLNPISASEAECRQLKLNLDDTQPIQYFRCACYFCQSFERSPKIDMYYSTTICKRYFTKLDQSINLWSSGDTSNVDDGVFTASKAYFIITDDLQVLPSSTGNAIRILYSFGITDTSNGIEIRNVTFGFNKIMDLLKGSLLSPTPLTDVILNKGKLPLIAMLSPVTAKFRTGTSLCNQMKRQTSTNTKKMTVKLIVQESKNKLLYAEADDDFVDFLFSLLTIPIGGVECLLGGSTSNLKNIENLYRSIADINAEKYMKSQAKKIMLLEPKLPFGCISKSQILPSTEEKVLVSAYEDVPAYKITFNSPKGLGNYVKGPRTFMVTDNLTVMPPMSTALSLSVLNNLKIPLSDVKELELAVGLEEALSIMEASLTSTCALTDGLLNPSLLKKKPKQEH